MFSFIQKLDLAFFFSNYSFPVLFKNFIKFFMCSSQIEFAIVDAQLVQFTLRNPTSFSELIDL